LSAPPPLPPPIPPGPVTPSFDFLQCLTFIKDDPRWLPKLLWGSLFSLLAAVFVGIPFLWGYQVRVIRRAAAGIEPPLPEWGDDLGGIFMDGLKVCVVLVAHWLGGALLFAAPLLALTVLPNNMPDAMAVFMVVMAMAMMATLVVAILALAVYVYAAVVRMALLDDIGEAFRVGENVAFLRRNLANTAFAWLAFLLAHVVSQFGIVLCCVGILPASFWATLVFAYALGQVARFDPERPPLARVSLSKG
jgi:hypothetical protein